MGKRELVVLLNLSSWCLAMVEWPFLAVPRGCLRFVIVVLPDHTHLLFFFQMLNINLCTQDKSDVGVGDLIMYLCRWLVDCGLEFWHCLAICCVPSI